MIKIMNAKEVSLEEILIRDFALPDVSDTVADIIADVRKNGDAAMLAYAKKFDGATLTGLELTRAERDAALGEVEPAFMDILREAAANIRVYY